jgi:uncharacterized membrane protein (DUF485 family)
MYNPYKKYKNFFKTFKTFHAFDINKMLTNLSTSKLLLGLLMIFMNIGSRYIELRLTNGQEMILKNIAREALIFTISFIATKDLLMSFIITGIFIILANFVFNEKSNYSILPEKYKKLASMIDTNNDKIISDDEINKAYAILSKARGQIDNYKKLEKVEAFNNISK